MSLLFYLFSSCITSVSAYVVSATHPALLTPAQARAAHGRVTPRPAPRDIPPPGPALGPGAQTGLQRFERPGRDTGRATWTPYLWTLRLR